MIRAFSSALEDDDLLVRRGALDLLLQSLRIDGVALRRSQGEDRIILMRAASSVVLRRDLSLNRRLYSWLLGPSEDSQQQMVYLKTYSLQLLSHTLRVYITVPQRECMTDPYRFHLRKRCFTRRWTIPKHGRSRSSSRYSISGRLVPH